MSKIVMTEQSSAPDTPGSGKVAIYVDTDGNLCWRKDNGVIVKIASAGTYTLTIPATGTAALLGTAQTFSAAQTFSNVLTAPGMKPASDSTTAWRVQNAAGSNDILTVDTTNGIVDADILSLAGLPITPGTIMMQPNGRTWTSRTSAADNNWFSVCYGNGLFVAVATSGTGNRVMTSPDGITWTIRTSAADNNWASVCYSNGLFVAVANSGTGNRVMTSPDGITWTSRTSAADNNWFSVCYGNGLFAAVANSGTGNRVMTCGKQIEIFTEIG